MISVPYVSYIEASGLNGDSSAAGYKLLVECLISYVTIPNSENVIFLGGALRFIVHERLMFRCSVSEL